ncbi:MAG TPA: hypothetical protein VFV57_06660 [Limnobacter sp.]|nr:hypothetical protein [Limnobacter sp.]
MKTRNIIATSILALSAALPAAVMANPTIAQGDSTTHVNAADALRSQATRQAVLRPSASAVQHSQQNLIGGDATEHVHNSTASTKTRAEVMSELRKLSPQEREEINAS